MLLHFAQNRLFFKTFLTYIKNITKLTDYFTSEQLAMYDRLQHFMYDYSLDKQTTEMDLEER